MAQNIMDLLKEEYKDKKVLVVGLGLQGGGAGIAKFFAELGTKVTVTDKKSEQQLYESINSLKDFQITYHLGGHLLEDFLNADVIFKGPSVPWTMPEIIEAEKKGVKIEMELSFFARKFSGKIIGITGTRGKSTTTQLIFNVLKFSDYPVFLGGGFPGISTISYLKTLKETDWVVMEISSWALSGFHREKISPHIAVFTNFYPDHLNYYNSMEDYSKDKQAIYAYQSENDYLIVKEDLKLMEPVKSKIIKFSKKDFPFKLTYLRGEHNLENAAAVLQVAKILEIDEQKAVNLITNFKGLPFRQEILGEKNTIMFVNDTTSTTPIATIKAIESFSDKKIILILGGNSKNLPSSQLYMKLAKVEKIILLEGSFTSEIRDTLREMMPGKISEITHDNLETAVKEAYEAAREYGHAVVLFSPGATSFSMFNNEFHRGREFTRLVKKILET